MEWLVGALMLQVFWDWILRIPKLREELHDVSEERDSYKAELEELQARFDLVDAECLEALERLDRIKDPRYYSALDAGDGEALYELDKSRGLI